jgi:NitT/TauT family transport system substrate-binding protein
MIRAIVATLAAVLLLAGPTHAQELKKVNVGVVGLTTDIVFYLADKRGYFKEEGIKVELINFDSGAKMIAPLGVGQLDVGGGATSAGLYNAKARGLGLRIVADKGTNSAAYSYKALLVRKDLVQSGAFKSLKDLKGKKIAVVAKGAADESVLSQAVVKAGLAESDIERVYLGFSQHLVAFEKKAIDAAIAAEPDITMMVRSGVATRFVGIYDFYPIHQTSVLLYNEKFAKDKATATGFLKAYLRAVRDYDTALKGGKLAGPGADGIIKALSEMTGIKDLSLLKESVPAFINPNGELNAESLQTDLKYFISAGLVSPQVTLDGLVDTSFITAVKPLLGPYKGGN